MDSQGMMELLPCPAATSMADMLGAKERSPLGALWDIAEFADAAGAEELEITLDLRMHGRQSLLEAGLASLQGPAICFRLPGALHCFQSSLLAVPVNSVGAPAL